MTLGQNRALRYGHFGEFLEDIMANLGLIDFKLDLNIRVNVNAGQNKFEVHISKQLAKIVINWHKIGQMPLFDKNITVVYKHHNNTIRLTIQHKAALTTCVYR